MSGKGIAKGTTKKKKHTRHIRHTREVIVLDVFLKCLEFLVWFKKNV